MNFISLLYLYCGDIRHSYRWRVEVEDLTVVKHVGFFARAAFYFTSRWNRGSLVTSAVTAARVESGKSATLSMKP